MRKSPLNRHPLLRHHSQRLIEETDGSGRLRITIEECQSRTRMPLLVFREVRISESERAAGIIDDSGLVQGPSAPFARKLVAPPGRRTPCSNCRKP